jgi:hypothetical protein
MGISMASDLVLDAAIDAVWAAGIVVSTMGGYGAVDACFFSPAQASSGASP